MSDEHRALSDLVDLSGRVAVVTGAGQGLGFHIATRLAEAGASVVSFDLDESRASSTCARIDGIGGASLGVCGDVADQADVERLVSVTVASFGRLDILVNNAGIYPQEPFLESDPETWLRIVRVNLIGTMLCSQAGALQMISQGSGGAIVNVASVAGLRPARDEVAAYGASKAGVLNFTRVLARSLAPHAIRVNALVPGGIETPGLEEGQYRPATQIPLGSRAQPDEVARAALFLASDMAAYMTGASLVVDGGHQLV